MRRELTLCLCLFTACRSAAPPLPSVDTRKFEPAVRDSIESAASAASANPNDAAKVTELALVLHAHDLNAAASAAYRRALALGGQPEELSYLLGIALAADGNYPEAAKAFEAAGNAVPARLRLADVWLNSGDSARARAAYQSLAAQVPNLPQVHFGLGRTAQPEGAIEAYRKALELYPRYGAAQFALATAYRQAGKQAEAGVVLANYERDKLLTPPLADPAMEKVAARNQSSTNRLRHAQWLDQEGRLPEALALHEQIVSGDPRLAQAWINLISLYARSGRGQDAERAFNTAIALAPDRSDAHYNFGVFCFSQQRWPDARRAFEHAVRLDPRNAGALHNLGVMLEQSGDLRRATDLFSRAVAAQPGHKLAHFHLGRIHANFRRYDQAIAAFEKAVEPLDEHSPQSLYALGAVHARAGRPQKAREILLRAQQEAARFKQQPLTDAISRDLGALSR